MSLPVLGVWIEVWVIHRFIKKGFSHSLYWECGLKLMKLITILIFLSSLPVLGVWIEVQVFIASELNP